METTRDPPPTDALDAAALAFGPFILHRSSQLLLKGGEAVRLGSRAFTLLVDLVESAGQLRTRAQLEARVWPRSVVEETSLRVHMSALRKALGDGRDGARYIANVPGCGYSFIATVTRVGAAQAAPAPADARRRLVGRGAELDALGAQATRVRLLSIIGPGGIGKTALALALAEQVRGRFADGVLLVDLSAAADAAGIVDSVARAAGLALPCDDRQAALCTGLGQRRLLLVLDNCDRVVDGAAALALALLQDNPGVHVLVTSREPLDVQGERVHWLQPLQVPERALDAPQAAMACAAVELFVRRAQEKDDRFVLDEGNAGDVCRLCRHLDGIPLAIELAAARVEALGVAGLADGIGDLLAVLTRARRTALPHQRTMEATLAWSFDLLDGDERAVLCRSAVFETDFSGDAARAVCACERIDGDAVARCIESLAARSLLVRSAAGSVVLYRQLQLTRSYARAKLDAGEIAALAHAHARHVAALLAQSPAAAMAQRPIPWIEAHGRSFDDFRAALGWAFGAGGDPALGAAMTPNLIHTLRFLSLPDDFRRHLLLALDDKHAPRLGPEAALSLYAALAILGAYSHTDFDLLRELMARLGRLLDAVAAPGLRMQALGAMGAAAFGMGDNRMLLDVVALMRRVADAARSPPYAAMADRLEASARHFLGEHDAALALCARLLASEEAPCAPDARRPIPAAVGTRWYASRIAWIRGRPEQAAQLAHEALVYSADCHPVNGCQTLAIAALPVALWRGDDAHARRLAARLQSLAEACNSPYWQAWARAYGQALERRADGAADSAHAWQEPLAPVVHDLVATCGAGMVGAATLARAEAGAIDWCAAEVLRAHGERLLRLGGERDAAEALFLRALALAQAQGALGWELRIARSLLECRRGGPRADQGRRLLAGVLGRFAEGRDGADWRAAAQALEDDSIAPGRWPWRAGSRP